MFSELVLFLHFLGIIIYCEQNGLELETATAVTAAVSYVDSRGLFIFLTNIQQQCRPNTTQHGPKIPRMAPAHT